MLKEKSIDFAGVIQKHPLTKDYQLENGDKELNGSHTGCVHFGAGILQRASKYSQICHQKVERGSRDLRFCPKCETRLRPVSGEEEEMACPKCGFKTKKIEQESRKESIIKPTQDVSLKVMEGDSVEALPTTSIECPQCKN